ncbi:unnamed protein product, partial [Vitrella brassicaformis CCMP3155]
MVVGWLLCTSPKLSAALQRGLKCRAMLTIIEATAIQRQHVSVGMKGRTTDGTSRLLDGVCFRAGPRSSLSSSHDGDLLERLMDSENRQPHPHLSEVEARRFFHQLMYGLA